MQPIQVNDVVELRKPFKSFPAGTTGWVRKTEIVKRQECLMVMFKYRNFSGSNRHEVIMTRKQCQKHLAATGTSTVFPAELTFVGGW